MILADTNSWIAYLAGAPGDDVEALDKALSLGATAMIPPVLAELLSYPKLSSADATRLGRIPELATLPGFWLRTGLLRAALARKRCKPKLVDTMVAQYCLDHQATLVTRDRDFKPFVRHAGLLLL